MTTVSITRQPGQTLYAFPDFSEGFSLSTWTTNRVELVEGTGANSGVYTAELDETIATLWRVFEGTAQPTDWGKSKGYFQVPKVLVNVHPSIGIGAREVAGDTIEIATDAARTIARSVFDEDDNPITLPASCVFVITDSNKALVATLTPAITGNSYTVTIPRSILKQEQDYFFALRRNDSTLLDFDSGVLRVVYVAFDPT